MLQRYQRHFLFAFILLSLDVVARPPSSIVVLDFELNDLTYTEDNQSEIKRTASLAPLLSEALSSSFTLIPVSQSAYHSANQGVGYLIQHPSVAADLGNAHQADWIVVTRLHKPSFLFAYLIAYVVHVPSGTALPKRIVEIKGQQAKLNQRGVNKLAEQITQQIATFKQ
ncbi:DUF2380 domain-containing protein [Enterovibrio nigricans]|uniref:DUF2380 domain-containing protein n=1 Tax=Enterovibrio nigricans DSM 22720 TaxID=1121868 RepID=A0A1T4U109_9GAMM|nr:DUF2380 domain-containing protein [Enterovibrio nigricans]SKA46426.1 Protein of unknown function [Enterovibrio nigricans DSM 22720]